MRTVTAPWSQVGRNSAPSSRYGFATSTALRGGPWHEITTRGCAQWARAAVFAAALPWWGALQHIHRPRRQRQQTPLALFTQIARKEQRAASVVHQQDQAALVLILAHVLLGRVQHLQGHGPGRQAISRLHRSHRYVVSVEGGQCPGDPGYVLLGEAGRQGDLPNGETVQQRRQTAVVIQMGVRQEDLVDALDARLQRNGAMCRWVTSGPPMAPAS